MMKRIAGKAATKNRECQKKRKSRDAARSRRGQQNDGYSELASQLPLPLSVSGQLDRLCVMRLVNSYIKMKQLMDSMTKQDVRKVDFFNSSGQEFFNKALLEALDGFVFVVTSDGQCLYVSDNVSHYMGLSQTEVCGNTFYKYVHPCDHEELANQLGGQIPLEDVEIFDGLFCPDSVFMMSNLLKGGSKRKQDAGNPYRSFSVRMKSILTSRGKSVNLKASTYRVVHCTGYMKMKTTVNEDGTEETTPHFMVAIGVPLMVASNFEVPLDRCTFTSRHSLDMKILSCDEKVHNLLGYSPEEIIGKSWYNFQHTGDLDIASACHKTLLTKGQSVSKYYRFLVRDGGWVWVQTKANVVYDSKTCQPQFIRCINYLLGGTEWKDHVLATEQINPVPLPSALGALDKTEEPRKMGYGKRKKDDIVLQERTKVLKAAASHNYASSSVKADPKESDCSMNDLLDKPQGTGVNFEQMTPQEKTLSVDCQQLNFQDFLADAWDVCNEFVNPSEQYNTPVPSPSAGASHIPAIPSPEKDECLHSQPKAEQQHIKRNIEENFEERAPFIPLPDTDATVEFSFRNSPFSWLMDEDRMPIDKGASAEQFNPIDSCRLHNSGLHSAGKANFAGNNLLNGGKCVPLVTQLDAEVNALLGASYLLQGDELLKALESGNLNYCN